MKNRPDITNSEVNGNRAVLTLRIDADIIFFRGHFESHPILPGVTQLHWVNLFGREYLGLSGRFAGMEAVKFKDPILPGSTIAMTLEWHEETGMLHFTCKSGTSVHSSGRIKLTA